MAEQDFTLQDIKDFMLEVMKYKWYGEIYDDEIGQYRNATIDDFNQFKRSTLFAVKIGSKGHKSYDSTRVQGLNVIIYRDTFRIPTGRDFSDKWQEFKTQRKTETLNV